VAEAIDRLGDPLPDPIVTERFLRSVSALEEFEQMRRIEERVLARTPRISGEAQTSEQTLQKPGATSKKWAYSLDMPRRLPISRFGARFPGGPSSVLAL